MESLNKIKILNLIRLYGPIARTNLAEMMEISIAAVSKYVSELLEEGIVRETGTEKSTGGRKRILLNIDTSYGHMITIDFGQSLLRAAVLDLNNAVIFSQSISSSTIGGKHLGMDRILKLISEVQEHKNTQSKLLAIGIAVSGIISENGINVSLPNLKDWENVDFITPITEAFHVPVYLDDSARMMALSESIIPGNGRHHNLIFISIGAGIGMGIIVHGRLLRGANGAAGELGHIIVQEDGLTCGCGNKGCLEQYASVTSMVNNSKRSLQDGVRSAIIEFANGDINLVDSLCISKAFKEHDKLATQILTEAGSHLGKGVSQLVNLFNPPRIILGGGGMKLGNIIHQEVLKACALRSLTASAKKVSIMVSEKDDNCALIGASIFAQDNLFKLTMIYDNDLL